MAIWHNRDILDEIARRITCPEDFVAFSRVSGFCRNAAVKENIRFTYQPIPWLMLPPRKGTSDLHHRFYSLLDGTCQQINMPDTVDNRCYSSKGWVLVIDKACNLFLLNPFSVVRIDLPHPTTFQSYEHCCDEPVFMQIEMIYKFALSVSPFSSEDYTVMVIYPGLPKLAFYRPGFISWIDVNCEVGLYMDVIYFQDKFYVIDSNGKISAIDIKDDNTVEHPLILKIPGIEGTEKFYLVESDGNLLVIHRVMDINYDADSVTDYVTSDFQVFHIDLEDKSMLEISDLGSRVIFVGDNSSLILDISSWPIELFVLKGIPLFKSNCIYFSDDCLLCYLDDNFGMVSEHGGKDMGVYDLKDRSVKTFDVPDYDTFGAISLPIWVEHTF